MISGFEDYFIRDEMYDLADFVCDENKDENVTNINEVARSEKFNVFKGFIEKNFEIIQAFAPLISFFMEDCCKKYNNSGKYLDNNYCFFELILSYGFTIRHDSPHWEYYNDNVISTKNGCWSHIYKFIKSNNYFNPYGFFYEFVVYKKWDLAEEILIKYKNCDFLSGTFYETELYLNLNEYDKIKVDNLLQKYDVPWIKRK